MDANIYKAKTSLVDEFNIGTVPLHVEPEDFNPCEIVNHEYLLRKSPDKGQINDKQRQIMQYTITTESILRAIEIQSKKNTSEVDKYLDIAARNVHGQFNTPKVSPLQELINEIISRWTDWYNEWPCCRSTPLLYKCYICSIGWWSLYPFQEHITNHQKISEIFLRLELENDEFSVVAARMIDSDKKDIRVDSNCLKCGKDANFHCIRNGLSKYKCDACGVHLDTCHMLIKHESICKEYIKRKQDEYRVGPDKGVTCPICGQHYVRQSCLDSHIWNVHCVRSDEPTSVNARVCNMCQCKYHDYKFHDCKVRGRMVRCKRCIMKFVNCAFKHIHMRALGFKMKCIGCNKVFNKCIAVEHYIKHSENYTLLYWCMKCTNRVVFTDAKTLSQHMEIHTPEKTRKWGNCMLVPKMCLEASMASRKEKLIIPNEKLGYFILGIDMFRNNPLDKSEGLELYYQVIALDDDNEDNDDPLKKGAQSTQHLDSLEMQAQLDADIERELDLEQTISEMFKKSKIYNIFVESVIRGIRSDDEEFITDQKNSIQKIRNEGDCLKDAVINSGGHEPNESEDYYKNNCDLVIAEQDRDFTVVSGVKREICEDKTDEESPGNESIVDEEEFTMVKEETYEEVDEEFDSNVANIPLSNKSCIKEEIRYVEKVNVVCKVNNVNVKDEVENNLESIELNADCKTGKSCAKKTKGLKVKSKRSKDLLRAAKIKSKIRSYFERMKSHNGDLSCPQCFKRFETIGKMEVHVAYHLRKNYKTITNKRALHSCCECEKNVPLSHKFRHWLRHCQVVWVPLVKEREELNPSDEQFLSEEKADGGPLHIGNDVPEASMDPKVVTETIEALAGSREVFKCTVCSKNISNSNECKRHMIGHLLRRARINQSKTGNMLECPICSSTFPRVQSWRDHVRMHSNFKTYKCPTCPKIYGNFSGIAKHKFEHDDKAFVCDLCNKKFLAKHNLSRHLKLHKDMLLDGSVRGAVFATEKKLKDHIRLKHLDHPRIFPCRICTKRFTMIKEQRDHMWLVHKARRRTADCPVYKKRFRKHDQVTTHLMEDHGCSRLDCKNRHRGCTPNGRCKKNTYQLRVCRERFSTLQKWDHLWLVHKERSRTAECPVCKKQFWKNMLTLP